MSFNLTLEEEPRTFTVSVGYCKIGTVKSYREKGDGSDEEAYQATRVDDDADSGEVVMGWHKTLEDAVGVIVEYNYGSSKITKITERPV